MPTAKPGRTPAGTKKAEKSSPKVYTDPKLRDRLKAKLLRGSKGGAPGQWSARKSQLLTQEYRKAGGGYVRKERTAAQKSLSAWTAENWTTKDGKPARRGKTTARYLPEEAWE